MTRRARPEELLQKAVADYLRVALPSDSTWHHSPNETKGTVAWHAKRKALGMRAGWPDIEIIWQGRAYFVELKAPGNYLSPPQKKTHGALLKAGAPVATCRRIEEVEGTLRGWGFPLRATTGARTATSQQGETA